MAPNNGCRACQGSTQGSADPHGHSPRVSHVSKNPTMKHQPLPVPLSLRGASIAIVGGENRPHALRRLRERLGCEVTHFETDERDASPRRLLRLASRAFQLIVWVFGRSRHAHGDFVRAVARAHGTPCVPMKSVPSPERLEAELARHRALRSGGGA